MSDKVVLGIHSAVSSRTQENGGSYDRFVDGHAWLSVTRGGKTEYYGLWPDGHPRVKDNGDGTDIRIGLERGLPSSADRYYDLTPAQAAKLEEALKANVAWSPTTTCAGWASDTVSAVTGRKIDAAEFLSIETPRALASTIHVLEAKQPTAPNKPHAPFQGPENNSSFRRDAAPDAHKPAHQPAAPHAAAIDPLYRDAEVAVRRLDASLGRDPDHHSTCMSASLACLARENRMDRIDHVVLGDATATLKKGENVFVVQGELTDPHRRIAFMKTQDALDTPVARSLERLGQPVAELTQPQAQQITLAEPGIQVRDVGHRIMV